MICTEALRIAELDGLCDFRASDDWLRCFMTRYDIKCHRTTLAEHLEDLVEKVIDVCLCLTSLLNGSATSRPQTNLPHVNINNSSPVFIKVSDQPIPEF